MDFFICKNETAQYSLRSHVGLHFRPNFYGLTIFCASSEPQFFFLSTKEKKVGKFALHIRLSVNNFKKKSFLWRNNFRKFGPTFRQISSIIQGEKWDPMGVWLKLAGEKYYLAKGKSVPLRMKQKLKRVEGQPLIIFFSIIKYYRFIQFCTNELVNLLH